MKFEKHYEGDQTAAYRVTVPATPTLKTISMLLFATQAWFKQSFSVLYVLLMLLYGGICVLLSVFPKIFVTAHFLLGLWFVIVVMLPKMATEVEGK